MKNLRFIRVGWVLVLAFIVAGVSVITPALASNNTTRHTSYMARQAAGSSLNAIIYLTTGMLEPVFQNRIEQQVPADFNNALTTMMRRLPSQDRGWAYEMATTLLQPSATLQNLAPQQAGLAMTLQLSFYPGDPKPITATSLISFHAADSSTVQVSATPENGSPALVSGPEGTFQIPLGSLNTIKATPGCGASALALNLQFPVSLSQASTQGQSAAMNTSSGLLMANQRARAQAATSANAFIEIPAASLASVSNSFGSMPVGNGLTAQNIRISVQGSNLDLKADILWNGLYIGTVDSTIAPSAAGGKLVLYVLNTNLSLFGFFPFPINSYNAQIEQTLNSKLGNAFAGKFYLTSAAIGPNGQLPCAAGDSLVLGGNMPAIG
ncbi:MAG TPA: hypothetical protein VKB35_14150 [Ktedonobacteraceae bacterium]|nr:hypothetical protein [Ktedonobacteraceae bacterium]